MHEKFLREHRPGKYASLLLFGKLWTYLADLDEQANVRMACVILQMQEAEGITEELKVREQMAWIGVMNNIRIRAEEVGRSEMIYL